MTAAPSRRCPTCRRSPLQAADGCLTSALTLQALLLPSSSLTLPVSAAGATSRRWTRRLTSGLAQPPHGAARLIGTHLAADSLGRIPHGCPTCRRSRQGEDACRRRAASRRVAANHRRLPTSIHVVADQGELPKRSVQKRKSLTALKSLKTLSSSALTDLILRRAPRSTGSGCGCAIVRSTPCDRAKEENVTENSGCGCVVS